MKDYFTKDKKRFAGIVVIIFVIIIFFLFAYMPQLKQVKKFKDDIRRMDKQIELTKTALGDMEKLGPLLGQMQQEMKLFEKRLASKKQISSIVSELSGLAQEADIEVISIKPEKPAPLLDKNNNPVSINGKRLDTIKIELKLQAPYKALAEYTKKIQDNLNILAGIDSLLIKSNSGTAPMLDAAMTLTICVADKE